MPIRYLARGGKSIVRGYTNIMYTLDTPAGFRVKSLKMEWGDQEPCPRGLYGSVVVR